MRYTISLSVLIAFSLHPLCLGEESARIAEIPQAVRATVVENAKANHPDDYATQLFVVRRQTEAYRVLAGFSGAPGIPPKVFSRIRNRANESHPDDYSTQLFVIRRQISAYRALDKFSTPPQGVAGSDFFAIKAKAKADHPDDYSTQLFVIRRQISAYKRMHGE